MTRLLSRAWALAGLAAVLSAQAPLTYPATRKADVVDDYHGTKVADPYRWLEDDRSPETAAWVAAQNRTTRAYLDQIPERKAVEARLTKLWDYEKFGAPAKRGKYYIYSHNTGLQNQSVLYVTTDLKQPGRVLLDPNALSKDGTVSLGITTFTDDGRLMAYSLSKGGADLNIWKVRNIETGQDLPDELPLGRNGVSDWTKDGSGFYYTRYPLPKDRSALTGVFKNQQLLFHKLGTPVEKDTVLYERPDQPDWGFGGLETDDGKWLVVYQSQGTDRRDRVFLKDLTKPTAPVAPWLDKFDGSYRVVGNDGNTFYVLTDQGAPRSRLVAIEVGKPESKDWKTLIPEGPGRDVLAGVNLVANRFVATWRIDALTTVRLYDLKGKLEREIALPGVGSLIGFGGRREDTEAFYGFTSYNRPTTLYRYDFATGKSEVFRQSKVAFDPAAFEVKEVFYPSKDGTKIPMFLAYRKGLKLDGQNPTLLYGYGGFNVPATPGFSPGVLAWMEMGGVYAHACLRGGSEYGRAWYEAGRQRTKQNVFDDFIAAAEWLIREKYTATPRLAIHGGSNGGLLVGACMTQRPDLFGAALPAVGVMDMLRYHTFTIGWMWKSDYDCSDDPEGFKYLMTYSPLHTLKPGVKYPPTLVTTGDHDDRVVPAHSHKFIATLQADQAGSAPVLTRIETDAGHGAGKPTTKQIAERADQWAFLVKNLGIKLPEGFGK
ncbi:prolyl oligopeptidase family protein [Geothrix sp. 21YS21S-4]|uniref:prolyl oligopeptidase family serine peptidase n=1 Tax=Geothrix sp. 21YS21S-4 TaxID=3068889 RepID=UPI0027BA2C70|nr:prolyl oligopeptidase family serine peptidase [Geothrix sp. 21YS21S-4]